MIEKKFDTTNATIISLKIEGETVGWVCVCPFKGGRNLFNLRVCPEHIGKGYGSELMQKVFDYYPMDRIYLTVGEFDHKALSASDLENWYTRLGFVKEGEFLVKTP